MSALDKITKLIRTFPDLASVINSKVNYYFNISNVPHFVYVHPTADVPLSYIEIEYQVSSITGIVPIAPTFTVDEPEKLEHIAKIVLKSKYTYKSGRKELKLNTIVNKMLKEKLFQEMNKDHELYFIKNKNWLTYNEAIVKDILE